MSSLSPVSTDLTWTEAGDPRSALYGDVYYSRDDGLAESRAVFLEGCGLPGRWAGLDHFTVAELGFGTGLNIVALLDLWRQARPEGARLSVFSIEAHPLSRTDAARALAAWPEVAATCGALLARWPSATPGFHRIDLPDLSATLDLAVGDAAWALDQWSGLADAWFLDGFSPAVNPAMWSPKVMDGVRARSAPGATVATFTVAGAVRRGLSERGFEVEKRPGHGRKRERLEARLATGTVSLPTTPSVIVIGAGIAGASVARALRAQGASVRVLEADRPGAGGSGFPSALVTPRLDAGDTTIAAFHAQALERAAQLYECVEGAVLARGVLQLQQAPRDAVRFAKVAAQPIWPEGSMTALDADTASSWLGAPTDRAGLAMADALVVRPDRILDDWLGEGIVRTGYIGGLIRSGDLWRVIDMDGQTVAQADAVVIACGWGAAALLPDLGLMPVRGQADWASGVTTRPLAWGGYAVPTPEGLLYGATHVRDDVMTDVRQGESLANRATLTARRPDLAAHLSDAPSFARVAIRATTPDRLPLCGPVAGMEGLHVLTGLGSRGFCAGPLLGDHLAALILDRPSPLPKVFADRLHPARRR